MHQQRNIPDRLKTITQGPLTEEKWGDFEDLLAEIDTKNNALLPELLESFACVDNQVDFLDCLWDMIHKLEAFEEGAYLRELIAQTLFLQEHAPKSLSLLWVRILNSATARFRLKHDIFPFCDIQNVRTYLLAEPDLETKARELFA